MTPEVFTVYEEELRHAGILFVQAFSFVFTFSPARTYLGISGSMAVSFALTVWSYSNGTSDIDLPLAVSLCSAVLHGVSAALPLALAFEAFPMIGRSVDLLRGAQASEQLAPLSGERSSVLEQTMTLGGAALFLQAGGFETLALQFHAAAAPYQVENFQSVLRAALAVLSAPLAFSLASDLISGVVGRVCGRAPFEVSAVKLLALPILLALALSGSTERLGHLLPP